MRLGLIFLLYGIGVVFDVLGDFAIFIGILLVVLALKRLRRKLR